jgi:glycosyltransferase involved in cell wall biosynthesis
MAEKQILFILPEYYEKPIGGYKVVFEYANKLVNNGYGVKIVYPYFLFFRKSSLKRKLKMCFFFIYYMIFKRRGVNVWFPLDSRVKSYFVFNLNEKKIPSADFYIATANETAVFLDSYRNVLPRQKFYLIQAIEDWQWGREAVLKTWKLNLNKIVVSEWLASVANSLNEKVTVIENGVDRKGLSNTIPISDKDKYQVMMLYHKQKLKGCDDGLQALKIVKEKYPMLKSVWFGSYKKPKELPEWIDYYKTPDENLLNDLFNKSGIYIAPSHSEGFGLTVGEAMTCGCAVACTNAGGYLTMAKNKETALISEIGNIEALASNIIELIENDYLRIAIAENGNEFIKSFTWDKAYQKFEKLFQN